MGEKGTVTDETFVWPLHEHCVVLTGYDKNYYYFTDPLDSRDTVKYDKKLVEQRYKEMGEMSLIIYRKRD